ncbi:RPL14, partial [Symbiodinium sp. KB8]
YVEIGRVALITYGPDEGKLCTIIDVVDQNRVLVDGPENLTGVRRQMINLRRIALTDFVVNIARNARIKKLNKEWKAADIENKWAATNWSKRIEASRKASKSTDFQRFKSMIERKQRMKAVRTEFNKLKKGA